MVYLVVGTDDTGVRRPLSGEPTYVGRGPQNHVVLDDRSISGRHLAIWVSDGRVWVEDLGSRNGTYRANGSRIRAVTAIPPGEVVRLGLERTVRVEGVVPHEPDRPMVVEIDSGAAFPVVGARFTFGAADDADVVHEGPEVVLVFHASGELWLATDAEEGPLAPDAPFEVGGRVFVVRQATGLLSTTWDVARESHPYTLRIGLSGEVLHAQLCDPIREVEHRVASANRATLLFLLGSKLHTDREASVPTVVEGWLDDSVIASGIWGRAGDNKNLNVLVTRLRAEIRAAGFNPWCLEKKQGQTRIQVASVEHVDAL